MDRVYSMDELSAIIRPILNRYHAERAMVFGSYARGEARPESDIDVIVFGGKDFRPTDIFAVAEELSVRSGKNVDVYEIRELNAESDFYQTVFSEGIDVA